MQTAYACDYSLQIGEAQLGTAPRTDTWVLLEYPRPWAAKAYEESIIPDAVKAHLDGQLQAMPFGRLQLISRGTREPLTDLALYLVDARWDAPRIQRFTLPSYEALLDMPLANLIAATADAGEPVPSPLYIVCTNGKRDICCARYGLPIYQVLRGLVGDHVWQCNHIGGHRFAATLVSFPYGIYHGRVTAENAPALAQADAAGELYLPTCRGRACVDGSVQAAEMFLREQTGITPVDAFAMPEAERTDEGWRVRFSLRGGSAAYEVRVGEGKTPFDIITNSGETSGKPGPAYHLIACAQL